MKEHVDDLNSIKDLTSNTLTVINIYAFDLQDQSTTKIYQLTDLDSINDIEIIDDKIFILGIDNSRLNKEYNRVGDNDYYYYSGEVIKVVDMSAGTDSELEVDFPISFSKTLDNNLLIYAHDGIQGYYFIEYNCNKQEFSKNIL